MSDEREKIIHRMQRELIGRRYEGASLGKITLRNNDGIKIANWLKNPVHFLLIAGSPGVGKTYVCSAMIGWIYGKVASLRYWDEGSLFEKVRSTMNNDYKGDYLKELQCILDYEFVIIDDMGSCGLNDWRREIWFEIINTRYSSMNPTVITTNFTKEEIYSQMGPRSASRILAKENCVIDLHGEEDLRTK